MEEIKLSLFADDMIVYVKNLKESIKTILELISDYNKLLGYKVSLQVTFVYTRSEVVEFEIKTTIPFPLASLKMNCLGIYLTKYV